MKRFKFYILIIMLLLLESGCDNNDELANALLYGDRSLPSLTTKKITNITSFSATSGGIITSDGGDDVTVCGIAYGESENPTINDNKVSIEEVTSDFIVNISGLLPETMYYVRAYATNNAGTAYGDNVSFTTLSVDPDLPTVTTNNVTNITTTSATGGGFISSIGGSPVTARGLAYGTSPSPTIAGNTVSAGSGSGGFSVTMTGLNSGTTYFVRAYATNSSGTAYGDNVQFTTQSSSANLPSVTTSNITNITTTSATGGGTVTSDGGATVTSRGIAYGTSPSPTIDGSTVSVGSGTGNFSANLTGLSPNTTYFVRAYATNIAGTAYGDNVPFTTQSTSANLPTITTRNITNITATSAISGGNVTSDGGATVTARGIAYGTSPNPIVAGNTIPSGSGTGSFTSQMTGLSPNTTYHVRAYATNSAGTAYGNNISFQTLHSGQGEWIKYWSSGVNDNALGLGGDGAQWFAAIRWMPGDLGGYNGYSVTKIRIFINDLPVNAFATIWQGNINNPVVVRRQQFAPVEEGWVEINLNNPYPINTSQELWVGWEIGDPGDGVFPAAFETSSQHDGKANLLQFGSNPWQFASAYGFQVVWNIEVYITQ